MSPEVFHAKVALLVEIAYMPNLPDLLDQKSALLAVKQLADCTCTEPDVFQYHAANLFSYTMIRVPYASDDGPPLTIVFALHMSTKVMPTATTSGPTTIPTNPKR